MTSNKFLLFLPGTPQSNEGYRAEMARLFPDMEIIVATNAADAAKVMPDIEQMMTVLPLMKQELFDAATKLKWFHLLTSGTDGLERFNIRKDVFITSGRGGPMYPVAEAGMSMLFNVSRNIQHSVRAQAAHEWKRPEVMTLLRGKRVVICGVGLIAEQLATMCKAFRMTVEGVTSRKEAIAGFDVVTPMAELKAAAARADYFVVLTPLSDKTRGLISREILAALKPTAYFINLARGALVDEEALIETLREKRIRGAALDVFLNEPLPASSPIWDLPNTIVTAHSAGMHENLWEDIVPICARNLTAWRAGKIDEMINKVER